MAAEGVPAPTGGWFVQAWGLVDGAANNRASMLQDVLAERPTEIEATLLQAVARRHSVDMPALDASGRKHPRFYPKISCSPRPLPDALFVPKRHLPTADIATSQERLVWLGHCQAARACPVAIFHLTLG